MLTTASSRLICRVQVLSLGAVAKEPFTDESSPSHRLTPASAEFATAQADRITPQLPEVNKDLLIKDILDAFNATGLKAGQAISPDRLSHRGIRQF